MKPLPTEFKKGDFDHKLVRREGDVAIFWRKSPHHRDAHYEVIVVQQHEASHRFGKDFEAAEGYPRSEMWGTAGWTYNTIEDAEYRFRTLLDAASKRAANLEGRRKAENPTAAH